MLSRNQIRQTALQYLYGASQSPEITEEQEEGIWDILMEPFRADYCKLRAKAVSGHLTRDYPDKAAPLRHPRQGNGGKTAA